MEAIGDLAANRIAIMPSPVRKYGMPTCSIPMNWLENRNAISPGATIATQ
jgi:hypothetical protein